MNLPAGALTARLTCPRARQPLGRRPGSQTFRPAPQPPAEPNAPQRQHARNLWRAGCPPALPDLVNNACVAACTGGRQRDGQGNCGERVSATRHTHASGSLSSSAEFATRSRAPMKRKDRIGQDKIRWATQAASRKGGSTLQCLQPAPFSRGAHFLAPLRAWHPPKPAHLPIPSLHAPPRTLPSHRPAVCLPPKPDLVNGACYAACTGGAQHDPVKGDCICPAATPDYILGSCVAACPAGTVRQPGTVNCVAPGAAARRRRRRRRPRAARAPLGGLVMQRRRRRGGAC